MFSSQDTIAQLRKTENSVIRTLFRRELSGSMIHRKPNPFGDSVPARLRMQMENILPDFALENGHIFMGFTNCNRYVLSYTIRPSEGFDNIYSRSDLAFYYKLHFWLFIPYKPVRRVASVLLFDRNGVQDNNLLVQMTGWEGDDTRLIVTGRSSSPERGGHRSLFYVTVTTIPPTQTCDQCKIRPFAPRDDNYSEAPTDGLKIRCLLHGLTAHTVVDRVEPFPKFNPTIQLAFKDTIILNTGNAFHMLTYKSGLPENGLSPPRKTRSLRCDFWFKHQPVYRLFANCTPREALRILHLDTTAEEEERNLTYVNAQDIILSTLPSAMTAGYTEAVPVSISKRRASLSSIDSDAWTDISIEGSLDAPSPPKSPPKPKRSQLSMLPPTTGTGTGRKFFKTGCNSKNKALRMAGSSRSSPHATSASSTPAAGTYDVFEVSPEEVLLDRSLSSYRKRRNADKEYEFTEPDSSAENIFPLTRSRARMASTSFGVLADVVQVPDVGASGFPRSPRTVPSPCMSPGSDMSDVLRPLTNNSVPLRLPLPVGSPNSSSDSSSISSLFCKSPSPSCSQSDGVPHFTTNLNCIGQVLRAYTEREDDASSVRTDTDDEGQCLAFPVALNLEVYASQALQPVSNSRVKNCTGPVLQVLQRTLDVELLCNEVSGMICLGAEKHFSSCFDYDVAIVDVCPERGSVTALAVVLIQATSLKFRSSSKYANYNTEIPPIPGVPDPRKKYEGIFSFVWEPAEERARILYIGNLQEVDVIPEKWHPTKHITPEHSSEVRVLSNDLVVYEWQSLDELTDATGVVTLYRNISTPTTSNSPYCAYSFASPTASSMTEDEDLSD